jgi:hypothetical protein
VRILIFGSIFGLNGAAKHYALALFPMLSLCKRNLATRSVVHSYYSSNYQYPLSLPHLDTFPLRSNRQPSNGKEPEQKDISDQEWEIRTGMYHNL